MKFQFDDIYRYRYFDGLLLRNQLTGWCLDPVLSNDYVTPGSLIVAPCLSNGDNAGDSPIQQMWLWGQLPGTPVSEWRGPFIIIWRLAMPKYTLGTLSHL